MYVPSVGDPDAEERLPGLEERIAAETRELERRARGRVSGGPSGVRYVFIGGCPRSGTTALTTFMNCDPRILLGQERFRRIRSVVEPFHFTEEILFNPSLRETSWAMPWRGEVVFPGSFRDYATLRRRWRNGGVTVLGDKAPYYYRELDGLHTRFPDAAFVILLRDLHEVAGSYIHRATNPVDHWPAENDHALALNDYNEALVSVRQFVERAGWSRLHIVRYRRFFGGDPKELERLYAAIGLSPPEDGPRRLVKLAQDGRARQTRRAPLGPDVVAYLEDGRDRQTEEWLEQELAAR
jgi:hypothetical protein